MVAGLVEDIHKNVKGRHAQRVKVIHNEKHHTMPLRTPTPPPPPPCMHGHFMLYSCYNVSRHLREIQSNDGDDDDSRFFTEMLYCTLRIYM